MPLLSTNVISYCYISTCPSVEYQSVAINSTQVNQHLLLGLILQPGVCLHAFLEKAETENLQWKEPATSIFFEPRSQMSQAGLLANSGRPPAVTISFAAVKVPTREARLGAIYEMSRFSESRSRS
ncbi:conserved hypothetical protein [Ricinus communis]|uniref:Uncharacterized protein n=1 Tax=Ricinus communis TaxID=3988 RepID=B9S7T2_RICCO|nr:conserved hypothetical protein [Ricinus communis]